MFQTRSAAGPDGPPDLIEYLKSTGTSMHKVAFRKQQMKTLPLLYGLHKKERG